MSALARANTAKAFSSPMRSKAAMVRSMAFPITIDFARHFSPSSPRMQSARGLMQASIPIVAVAPDLQFRHPHHLEDHGDRPTD
jgi:hypothetical protein